MKRAILLLAILLVCTSTIKIRTANPQEGTLQNLINMASEGDTVYLPAGVYYEHLHVNKPLTIVGAPTTIDGDGSGACLQTVTPFFFNGVRYGRGFNVTVKNVVVQNAQDGFCLELCSDCVIENCTIENMRFGINMADAHNQTIKNNIFRNNDVGIDFYGAGNAFVGNRFENTSGNAVHICGDPIFPSADNTFQDNVFLDNGIGIYVFHYSNNNRFYRNTFINSTWANVQIGLSFYNLFYYNNFFKGTGEQVIFEGYAYLNYWNRSTTGNYWSDYNGTDRFSGVFQNVTGSDGIGDTPYILKGNNIDQYPLMTDPPYDGQPPIVVEGGPSFAWGGKWRGWG